MAAHDAPCDGDATGDGDGFYTPRADQPARVWRGESAKAEKEGYEMNCRICGRQDARIRLCELNTARITKRAHVDCHGHSEYRSVTVAEVDEAAERRRERDQLQRRREAEYEEQELEYQRQAEAEAEAAEEGRQ